MIGVYLSGTGNTKHCIEKLIHLLDENAQAISIEGKETVRMLLQHDFIVLAYPVQFSNMPVMVRDFITIIQGSGKIRECFALLPWNYSAETAPVAPHDC